jgi:hypothetical protein
MLVGRTVFVLGAGSSAAYNFPLGSKLIDDIRQASDFKFEMRRIVGASHEHDFAYGMETLFQREELDSETVNKFRRIKDAASGFSSIDDFIDFENDEKLTIYAKCAIAYFISTYEENSVLKTQATPTRIAFDGGMIGSWIEHLWKIINKGNKKNNPDKPFEDLSIINFNYDRCVEYYLSRAFQSIYEIDKKSSHDFINSMNIIHPYGSLGQLDNTPYGIPHSGEDLGFYNIRSKNILTYTESVERNVVNLSKEICSDCEYLVFLGFGFHPQNMKLLKDFSINPKRAIIATTMGLSGFAKKELKSTISSYFCTNNPEVYFHDGTCEELMLNYQVGLIRSI